MSYRYIIYETGDKIARITLNRPDKFNALNYPMKKELVAALKDAEADDDVSVVILKGAGKHFSAGIELGAGTIGDPGENNPPRGFYLSPKLDELAGSFTYDILGDFRVIWDLLKPVIAQVHGYCLTGAFELATVCDLRMVAEDAVIGDPMKRVRAVGHLVHHPWMMGLTKGKELLLTGTPMSGKQAVDWHWANYAYPLEHLEEETEKLARQITTIPSEVLMLSKRACNRSFEIMGFKVATDVCSDLFTLGGYYKEQYFHQMAREQGARAALERRDGPWQDYSQRPKKPARSGAATKRSPQG